MSTAYLLIRESPNIRRDIFASGFAALGYAVTFNLPARVNPGDVVCLWNGLHFTYESHVKRAAEQGARVLIAENGYIGLDANGKQLYAIAEDGHNGSGTWYVGDHDRWIHRQIEVKPWRKAGDHIIVCVQRGIGSTGMRSPHNWHHATAAKLRNMTKRTIIVREHGGKPACHKTTTADMQRLLSGAHAVVVWSSANGVRALVEGVPVIYQAPHWICASAASTDLARIENPPMPERMDSLQRLAWSQWTAAEITDGVPFTYMLNQARRAA